MWDIEERFKVYEPYVEDIVAMENAFVRFL